MGNTLEVDRSTIDQDCLVFGRVKVLLGGSVKLPTRLTLCFGDLFTSVLVEEEFVQVDLGDSNLADDGSFEEDDDDVMLTGKNSKFDIPSSADEFDLMFQGCSDPLGYSPGKTSLLDVGLDLGYELGLK